MRVIGHRGCPAHGPENTVEAVQRAARHVDAIEIDVQRCGSGELVVFHDETLDRMTGATGHVRDTDWQTLASLTVGESDEPIPQLGDVLDAIPAAVAVNVELKHAGMAHEVAWAAAEVDNEVLISSFETEALGEMAEASDLPLAYIFAEDWDDSVETARRLGCRYLHPEYHQLLDAPERIDAAHDAGFEVNTWTVQTRDEVERLRELGVDGVVVDDWELAETG